MKSSIPMIRLVLLIAVASIGGCTEQRSDDNHPVPAPRAAAKYRIAGIGFQDDQFFKLVEAGMKDAAVKHDVEFSSSSSAGSLDKEISLLETFSARKVNAIVVAPLSAKASVPALKRAHDAGIKIVTFDAPLEADFQESSVKSDPVALGSPTGLAAKEYIQKKLGGRAKIAIITYRSLLPEPAAKRTKGFKDEVSKLPGVQFVAEQDAWLAPQAVNVVEGILTAHLDLNIIWAANEGGTVGAVTAVKNAGKAGKVAVFGTDISEQMADFLLTNDSILQAVTGQKPFEIGAMSIETAVKAVKGEKVAKNVELRGVLFTRDKPEEVRKYKDYLRGLNK